MEFYLQKCEQVDLADLDKCERFMHPRCHPKYPSFHPFRDLYVLVNRPWEVLKPGRFSDTVKEFVLRSSAANIHPARNVAPSLMKANVFSNKHYTTVKLWVIDIVGVVPGSRNPAKLVFSCESEKDRNFLEHFGIMLWKFLIRMRFPYLFDYKFPEGSKPYDDFLLNNVVKANYVYEDW